MVATHHDTLIEVRKADDKTQRHRGQGKPGGRKPWVNDQPRDDARAPELFTSGLPDHLTYCSERCGAVILISSVSRSTCLACRRHVAGERARKE